MIFQRRFGPFFATQCLGAFNDNLFKNVLVLLVTFNAARFGDVNAGILSNVAAALFILPFVLFSAPAGQLADQRDKAWLIRIIKTAEIAIMVLAGIGLALSNLPILLAALFLMGTHSAFFGPLKYSILPQVFNSEELIAGNAWVEMGTFVAILLGTLAAGYLVNITHDAWSIGLTWIGVAVLGWLTSLGIPAALPPAGTRPTRLQFGWSANRDLLAIARSDRAVWLAILAISWFWLIGSVVLAQLPALVQTVLRGEASAVTGLLAVFSISVGIGSMLCERLSGRRVEIGLVPLGSLGISVFAVDLWWTCEQALSLATAAQTTATATTGHTASQLPADFWTDSQFQRIALDLGLLGLFSGFFIVPLYSFLQWRTPLTETSRVIAANNVLNALFMVVGAGAAAAALAAGLGVHEIILAAGVLNLLVAVYIYTVVPEFMWRFMVWIVIHTLYRVEREGLHHVPKEGPAVLICNHVSFLDAVVIAAYIQRPIRFVMDHQIFRNPALGWLFRTTRAIPVAPQSVDAHVYEAAFHAARSALSEGELVCIFPEGKLTSTGELNAFKNGIQRIVQESPHISVVPMALSGLWGSTFSRKTPSLIKRVGLRELLRTVRLHVGEPIADERRFEPTALRDVVLMLRGNWR